MKSKIELAVRLLLGLMLAAFGADKFLHFLPKPELGEAAGKFFGTLVEAGYFFPVIGIVFLVVAALLFLNRAVPFALVLVAPISVNILLYHFRYDLPGIGAGVLLGILLATLAWFRRESYAPLFK